MQITGGKIVTGERLCVYGAEGIGKSTFMSRIPGVVFIDTEGSTNNMDVRRLPKPTSWSMLMSEVDDAIRNAGELSALIIDTADWAERLLTDEVLAKRHVESIGDIPYGVGYEILKEEFGKLLNKLTDLSNKGVHVGFTAHAMMRKFEQPDELGAYDRWEMKTSKKVAPLIKEWATMVLFANYKTIVYATDKDGKKHKASGGQRVMYASHHPCWDAKNRHGLPDEMPFDFGQVERFLQPLHDSPAPPAAQPEQAPAPAASAPPAPKPAGTPDPDLVDYTGVPSALADLMRMDRVTPFEVKAAVAKRGYFPMDTPWDKYPQDFIDGVLIGAWAQVRDMVLANREDIPF